MKISIKDNEGNLYENNMQNNVERYILELHFCTSYTEAVCYDVVDGEHIERHIIVENEGANPIDLLCIGNDKEIGYWVKRAGEPNE